MTSKGGLFPALLRYWRQRRGLSQLDLAGTAEVSARHLSFLETGRAQPSRDMVLRLAASLRVPLRDRNVMLHAAGFAEAFAEPDVDLGLTPAVRQAIDRMMTHHEPYPLVIMDRHYTMKNANQGALRVLGHFVADRSAVPTPVNALRSLFDPRLARTFVVDWERTARGVLSRLHLEVLENPGDTGLGELMNQLLAYPDVPEAFRQPDFSEPGDSTLTLRLRREELEVGFILTMTVFNAPGNVTLDELRIESYFPADPETERICKRFAGV